jgi:hypothetical protein
MREHGLQEIFTNKLKNTRTVKCYAPRDTHKRNMLVEDLRISLQALDIKFDIRETVIPASMYSRGPAIIVEVPFQDLTKQRKPKSANSYADLY